MIFGPLFAQGVINAMNKGVADSDIVYPMELFLVSAVVLLFCLIPSKIVRNAQDEKHRELMSELEENI